MISPFHVSHKLSVLDLKPTNRHEDETEVFNLALKASQYIFYFRSEDSWKGLCDCLFWR